MDTINLAGRDYEIRHTGVTWVHEKYPHVTVSVHQDIWDRGGDRFRPHIDFSTWTGMGGENGDCDSNTVAIFRIRKWHDVSKTG